MAVQLDADDAMGCCIHYHAVEIAVIVGERDPSDASVISDLYMVIFVLKTWTGEDIPAGVQACRY